MKLVITTISTPSHIIYKLQKTANKEKILREKTWLSFKRTRIKEHTLLIRNNESKKRKKLNIQSVERGNPAQGSCGYEFMLLLPRVQVQALLGELRSHRLCGQKIKCGKKSPLS